MKKISLFCLLSSENLYFRKPSGTTLWPFFARLQNSNKSLNSNTKVLTKQKHENKVKFFPRRAEYLNISCLVKINPPTGTFQILDFPSFTYKKYIFYYATLLDHLLFLKMFIMFFFLYPDYVLLKKEIVWKIHS